MPFFNNLGKLDTWSIAADFNHIKDPWGKPTTEQTNHHEPSLSDRIGGSVLFALSLFLLFPAVVFYIGQVKK